MTKKKTSAHPYDKIEQNQLRNDVNHTLRQLNIIEAKIIDLELNNRDREKEIFNLREWINNKFKKTILLGLGWLFFVFAMIANVYIEMYGTRAIGNYILYAVFLSTAIVLFSFSVKKDKQ